MPPTTPAEPHVQPGDISSAGQATPLPEPAAEHDQQVALRRPTLEDGARMWELARDSGGLDLNTSYAYLLFARDFAQTCRIALVDGESAGFVLGYLRPDAPDTLFVWQIAVSSAHRGRRLAGRLLDAVAGTPGVRYVEATITADNTASQRLFARLAERHGTDLTRAPMFEAHHFPDGHDAEGLVRIGPLRPTDH